MNTIRTYQREIRRLRELLDDAEWVQPMYNGTPSCSQCGYQKHEGHTEDCPYVTELGRKARVVTP